MSEDQIISFFKTALEKLQRKNSNEHASPEIKEGPFTFQVEEEQSIPSWARDLQREVGSLRNRIESNESEGHEEEELQVNMFPYKANTLKNSNNPQPKRCYVCNKPGHLAKYASIELMNHARV